MSLNQRYLSLDVFRGMDVALMIVVNSLGSYSNTYTPLLHADWNGFTLTDFVFPTFLFAVGNAMSFSQAKYEAQGESAFLKKIIIRTVVIFLLGYLMYWFPFVRHNDAGWYFKEIGTTRIFGVLQRIALCYFFASLIIHYFKIKGALIFSLCALVAYRFLLSAFGDMSLEGNAVVRLDTWLVGTSHLYKGEGVPFDPEGLLSTLPAIVNVIAGYAAGLYLQRNGKNYETIAKLLMVGVVLVLGAIWWDLLFPINKKLWTSSYVLLTVGIELLVLSILVFIIEIAGKKNWTYFFEVFGRNTLFIYLLSEIWVLSMFYIPVGDVSLYRWLYVNLFKSWAGNYNGSPLFALWIMLTCWLVGYWMDKKKIYVKV
jgi:predicted acyltransferase